MSDRKSAEERAKKHFKTIGNSIEVMFSTSPESCFISGYREGVRAAIEELRSKDPKIYTVMPPTFFADWLEERMKEMG